MRDPGLSRRALRRAGSGLAAVWLVAAVRLGSCSDPASLARTEPAPWVVGRAVPIAVAHGRARFDVPSLETGAKTLVIVSALGQGPEPVPLRLTARPIARARPPELASESPVRTVRAALKPLPAPPSRTPRPAPRERTFHLLVRDGDAASASNYRPITAELRAVGRSIQVYVDREDLGRVGAALLRDLVATFDREVYPALAGTLGLPRDLDGDGRFTVLISGWLTRLADGRYAVDGFVRGADFDPQLAAPFGNRCDMMYLSAALTPGPYLRTVVAHEFTHAITFSHKSAAAAQATEEEGWLDEALAHLIEDRFGFSKANLDYRVSAFLARPERYRLVVRDYYAADLFRSHGNRGSAYLFLRWCADRFGPELAATLIRSPLRGIANLEAATGTAFPDLYRRWSIALYQGGLEPRGRAREDGYRSLDLRGRFGARVLAGPRTSFVAPGGPEHTWSAAATTSHYVVIGPAPAPGAAVEVRVEGPPEAELQVTALPLPADLPVVELTVRAVSGPAGQMTLRARVVERGGAAVRLQALVWEPLIPGADLHAEEKSWGQLDSEKMAALFGTDDLPAGGVLASRAFSFPANPPSTSPLVIKLLGTDAHGRRVAAWAEVNPPTPALELGRVEDRLPRSTP